MPLTVTNPLLPPRLFPPSDSAPPSVCHSKRYVAKRFYLLSLCLLCLALSTVVIYYSLDEILAPGTFQTPCYLRWWGRSSDLTEQTQNVTDVANVTDATYVTTVATAGGMA